MSIALACCCLSDWHGNVYICDSGNHRIRVVNIATGIITTVVGNGTKGVGGDDMPGPMAQVSNPRGVVLDTRGELIPWAVEGGALWAA
jgi:hypothetical protein